MDVQRARMDVQRRAIKGAEPGRGIEVQARAEMVGHTLRDGMPTQLRAASADDSATGRMAFKRCG